MHRVLLASVVAVASAAPLSAADPSYTTDVKPFVQKYCADCHTADRAKAGVRLESLTAMLAPTRKGAAVVPGKPDKSLLVLTLTGGAKTMPPRKYPQKPTKDEIAVVRDWIAAGAKDDTPKTKP